MKKFIEIIKKLYTKNKVVFLISSFVVLVALGLLVWYFILNPMLTDNSKNTETKIKTEFAKVQLDSNIKYDKDGYKKFAEKIDNFISSYELESQMKISLLKVKAVSAFNSKNYEDSYQTALKIEELQPTYYNAELIGDSLVKLNKKNEAIQYYKKAIERITGNEEVDYLDISSIQSKIDNLNQYQIQ